ncbi:hypothetical protein BSKO_10158 [Bryopsis sp. KO-2023]|nr:hypothetical protein BSKO_10158 [Bryopsis sp. KO-2023]
MAASLGGVVSPPLPPQRPSVAPSNGGTPEKPPVNHSSRGLPPSVSGRVLRVVCEAGKAPQVYRRPPDSWRDSPRSVVGETSPFRSVSPEARTRKKRTRNLGPFKAVLAQRARQKRQASKKSASRKDVIGSILEKFALKKGRPQLEVFLGLGMSEANITKLVRLRREITLHRPSTIIRKLDFFRKTMRMSNDEIKKVLLKYPRILEYNTETTLVPRQEFLMSIGIEMEDMRKILLQAPSVMVLSVENTLQPRLEFLKNELGLPDGSLPKILVKHPHLMTYTQESMNERANFLRGVGLNDELLGKSILSHPQVLHYSVDSMSARIEYFRSIGVEDSNLPKMLSRMPQLLSLSIEVNVAPKFDFLCDELGGGHQTIEKSPVFLALSLEKRIMPRYYFMKQMSPRGIKLPAPMDWFKCSDKVFAGKFAKAPLEQFIAFKESVVASLA